MNRLVIASALALGLLVSGQQSAKANGSWGFGLGIGIGFSGSCWSCCQPNCCPPAYPPYPPFMPYGGFPYMGMAPFAPAPMWLPAMGPGADLFGHPHHHLGHPKEEHKDKKDEKKP